MSMAYSRRLERVEVFGEGLPFPLDPLVQRGAGDVLDALHELDEPRLLARAYRARSRPRSCRPPPSSRRARRRAPAPGPRWPDRRSACGCRRSRERRSGRWRRSPRPPRRRCRARRRRSRRRRWRRRRRSAARPVPSTIVPPLILRSYMAELYCQGCRDPKAPFRWLYEAADVCLVIVGDDSPESAPRAAARSVVARAHHHPRNGPCRPGRIRAARGRLPAGRPGTRRAHRGGLVAGRAGGVRRPAVRGTHPMTPRQRLHGCDRSECREPTLPSPSPSWRRR